LKGSISFLQVEYLKKSWLMLV